MNLLGLPILFVLLSTPPEKAESKPERLFTLDEILAPRGSNELRWALGERSCNGVPLFVTVHEAVPVGMSKFRRNQTDGVPAAGESGPGVGIYRRTDQTDGTGAILYKELAHLPEGKAADCHSVSFGKPSIFWPDVERGEFFSSGQFVHVTEFCSGPTCKRNEHVYHISCVSPLERVEIDSASAAYAVRLNKGEKILRDAVNSFGDDGLFFSFCIWNEGDGDCYPTGGGVSGAYKIVECPGSTWLHPRYRIVPDTFYRYYDEPLRPAESLLDYLKYKRMDSSLEARKALFAKAFPAEAYRGVLEQNKKLLATFLEADQKEREKRETAGKEQVEGQKPARDSVAENDKGKKFDAGGTRKDGP